MYKPYLTPTIVLTIPCLGQDQSLFRTEWEKHYIPCVDQRGQKPYHVRGTSLYRPYKGLHPTGGIIK